MLKRITYILTLVLLSKLLPAQCPQIYDYLGNLVNKPYFIDCQGTGSYNMNFASNTGWGAYTIDWGDGTTITSGGSYTVNSLINHVYNSASPDTFVITLSIPSLGCTLTGISVMEKPVNASIQIPIGGVTTACAPKALLFTNSSTDVSETTWFTWNFGDGTPVQTFNFSNSGQTISHTYNPGTVNCQTAVTLTAKNYCTPVPTIANFNPIQIYDRDDAAITPSAFIKCWPDNIFTFSNTTNRNCVPQGNTFQRQEKWNLGNYWGLGHDSIIGWRPWPPTSPLTVAFPAVGTYTVLLQDSNLCGVDIQVQSVTIVNPPVAGVVAPAGPFCQGSAVTFTNASATGYSYKWNFGTGGGFVSKPFGAQTFTYNTPGTYTISVVALIGGGGAACTDTEKVVINILPRPTANFTISPNQGCNSISGVTFTDLSASANTWNWNFGNSNTFNGQVPPSQNYNSVGNYVASLTVTAANTCVHTFTASVKVHQIPVAAFTASNACVGSPASFIDNSTFASGDPIVSWHWDFGDASTTATTTVQSPSHTFSVQNTYTTQLIVNTANCSDTISQTITINVKPTADFTLNPLNGCPTLTVDFSNSSVNATSYNWDFGNGNTSIAPNPSGTFTNTTAVNKIYTVTLTALTPAGCSDTHTASVTVFTKPSASFTVNAPIGCSPVAATFTNTSTGASSYLWTFGDASSSTSTTSVLSHTFVNSSLVIQTFTTQLTAISSNGCKDSTSLTVTSYPRPIFNFTMVPNSGCSPLNVNFPPVLGAVTYEWDFGDGSPTDFSPNPNHVFTNTTTVNKTYTVQLIASNAFSCIDTTYGYPIVFAKPQAGFAVTPTVGCSPLATTFTNTSIAGSTYLWKFGDGNTASTANTNHTYTNTSNTVNQTFTCSLVAISANGCRDSLDKTLLVYFKPFSNFALDTPRCLSKTITFTNTSQGSVNDSWNFGDGSPLSGLTNPTHTYTNNTINNVTYSVQLISTSTSGCKDTSGAVTTIFAKPIAGALLTPTAGCSPLPVTMNSSSSFAHSYIWKFGDGNSATTANTTHIYTNPSSMSHQTFSCTLIATNNNGCMDSITIPVLTYFKPIANFSIDTPKCLSKTINFSNNTLGSIGNVWDFGDFSSTSASPNPVHTYTNSSSSNITFTVQLIVTTANGCKDTTLGYPEIYAKPVADFVMTPTVSCSPLNTGMTNSSLFATSYLWKYGDGNTDIAYNTAHTYTNSSNTTNQSYNCTLLALNSNGCKDSITKPVLVLYNPKAGFTVDTPACSPKLLTFTNTSTGAASYNWAFGTGTSGNTNISVAFTNTTTTNLTQTVQLIATTLSSCNDTIVVPVIVHPKPEFTIVAMPDSGCSPLIVNFPTINNVANYQWKFGDGNISTADNPLNVYYNNSQITKTFSVQLIGIDGYGCRDTSSKVIKVFASPIALFQANPTLVYVPTSAVVLTNLSSNAVSYYWNFGDGNTSTETSPSYTYLDPGEYQIYLVAKNSHGCRDTFNLPTKIIAELESTIEIPNAFSPNPNGGNGGLFSSSDSNNDVFHPVLKGIDKYELNIFSRWGELLFVSKDITIGWDGYYKGSLCTQDVYVWKIMATTLDGKKINKTGDLLLLR
ncbi:MAG: Microbial collagenase precursor [Bacteroidetes bacterium]|jgi:PKD repeat protein|nr:Microbial collagenase precursor [Bacteroidota bacterium]MDF2453073.1 Microbial collagenase precursor [Bacteroidota bacterium]